MLPGHLTGKPFTGMWRVALDGVTHIRVNAYQAAWLTSEAGAR